MTKLSMKNMKGWLTREDVEKLEEAAKRPLKYAKVPAHKFVCEDCSYNWFYDCLRCPVCSSGNTKRIK